MRVELEAIKLAKDYFESEGYGVDDVSRKRGHNGYDFIITRDRERQTVEVKGCSREWQIPDLFGTEFDESKRLIADLLCVIYLCDSTNPSVCIIPREAIPPDHVVRKTGYRISGKFKRRDVLEKYWKPLRRSEAIDK